MVDNMLLPLIMGGIAYIINCDREIHIYKTAERKWEIIE